MHNAPAFVARVMHAAHVPLPRPWQPLALTVPCAPCRGSGRVPMSDRTARDSFGWVAICPDCDGSGNSTVPTVVSLDREAR